MFGISRGGDDAETMFCAITDAERTTSGSSDGDVRLAGHYVEVKATSSPGYNLNQIRAFKYIPLAVLLDGGRWHVIPAHEIVRIAVDRAPQHALNPLECLKLTLDRRMRADFGVDESALRETTLTAIEQSAQYERLLLRRLWLVSVRNPERQGTAGALP